MSKRLKQAIERARGGNIKQIRKDIRLLKRRGGPELKFVDIDVNSVTVATTLAHQGSLILIPVGDGEGQRDGRLITITRLHFQLRLTLPSTSTVADASDVVRLILWKDKQTNGALPSGTGALLTTGTAGIDKFHNKDHDRRNVIMWDRTFALNASGGGNGTTWHSGPVNRMVVYNRKVRIPMVYDDSVTTGATASIRSNNIYLSHVSLNGKASLKTDLRVFYTDP